MNLVDAIRTVHIGKYQQLDVTHFYVPHRGSYCVYDPAKDEGYQSYCRARHRLSKHKIIENILKWIKVI